MLLPLGFWVRNPGQGVEPVWRWRLLVGVVVMLVTLACWLVPMLVQVELQGGENLLAYRNDLLFRQTGERFVNAWHHVKPWHYSFTQAIPVVWFPLPIVMLVLIRPLMALLRQDAKLRVLLAWVGLVLLFFSLSSGKREVYIFPALPMLSLVVAVLWVNGRELPLAKKLDGFFRWLMPSIAALLTGLGLLMWLAPERLPGKLRDYADIASAIGQPLVALGLALIVLLVVMRKADLFVRLASASLLGWLLVSLLVWPRVDPHRTPNDMMLQVEQRLPPGAELGLIYFKEQFLLFSQPPLTHFSYLAPLLQQEQNAWIWMREAPGRHLLVPTDAELGCFDGARVVSLGEAHRREWVLLGPDGCGRPVGLRPVSSVSTTNPARAGYCHERIVCCARPEHPGHRRRRLHRFPPVPAPAGPGFCGRGPGQPERLLRAHAQAGPAAAVAGPARLCFPPPGSGRPRCHGAPVC
jgi:hypothetical protein